MPDVACIVVGEHRGSDDTATPDGGSTRLNGEELPSGVLHAARPRVPAAVAGTEWTIDAAYDQAARLRGDEETRAGPSP